MRAEALRAEDVSTYAEGKLALKHVSFQIFKGELTAVYGTFHSGIQYLAKACAGQIDIQEGSLFIDEKKLQSGKQIRKVVSYLGQESNLVEEMTIAENLMVVKRQSPFLIKQGWNSFYVQNTLSAIGVQLHPNQFVWELTSEQKKIIEVCKAVLMGAVIIILDNLVYFPESSNDRLFQVIRAFMKHGVTFLYFGSMYDGFFEKADRVLAVRSGHMGGCFELQGRTEELFNRMVYASKRTPDRPIQIPKPVINGKVVMSIKLKDEQVEKEVVVKEGMAVSIEADSQTCESLSRMVHRMAKRSVTKMGIKLKQTSWEMEKSFPYDMGIIPFDYKKNLICEDLSAYDNAYLNLKGMDFLTRMSIRFEKNKYFIHELDRYMKHQDGWAQNTAGEDLSLRDQRKLLFYKNMLWKRPVTVLIYPTSDLMEALAAIKESHVTAIIITDTPGELGNIADIQVRTGGHSEITIMHSDDST